jgi:hypothetical protein
MALCSNSEQVQNEETDSGHLKQALGGECFAAEAALQALPIQPARCKQAGISRTFNCAGSNGWPLSQ